MNDGSGLSVLCKQRVLMYLILVFQASSSES